MTRFLYIVEDEAPVRRALRLMLSLQGYSVTLFSSGTALLEALDALKPGVILLDVRLPGPDGIEVLLGLKARLCDFPAIMMTGHGEFAIALAALRSGALSLLEKPFSRQAVSQALETAFLKLENPQGFRSHQTSLAKSVASLSKSERALLEGFADGGTDDELASSLGLPSSELELRRSVLFGKLGVASVNEALVFAFASRCDDTTLGNFT